MASLISGAQASVTTVTDGGTSVVDFLLDPEPRGDVTGTVTDNKTGFAIQGANVSADTGQSVITDANGSYALNDVPTGNRTVTPILANLLVATP